MSTCVTLSLRVSISSPLVEFMFTLPYEGLDIDSDHFGLCPFGFSYTTVSSSIPYIASLKSPSVLISFVVWSSDMLNNSLISPNAEINGFKNPSFRTKFSEGGHHGSGGCCGTFLILVHDISGRRYYMIP